MTGISETDFSYNGGEDRNPGRSSGGAGVCRN